MEGDLEGIEEVADWFSRVESDERGGADVEGPFTAKEVAGAAADIGVGFEERGFEAEFGCERRGRETSHTCADDD